MRKCIRLCMSILTFPLLMSLFLVMPGSAVAAGSSVTSTILQSHHGGVPMADFGDGATNSPSPASALRLAAKTRVGSNVQVNAPQLPAPNGLIGRSETSIAAINGGQSLVAGWNDARGFLRPPFGNSLPGTAGLSGYGFSSDGGQTWTDAGAPPVFNHIVTRGDPWMSAGGNDNQTFFYANLAVDDRLPAGQVTLGVSVHRGAFSGSNFAWNDVHLLQAPNYPNDGYDKESITVGRDANAGSGYVTVTNFKQVCGVPGAGFGQIEVWRTHDGGNTWQGPVVAGPDLTTITDPNNPQCGATGILQQSSSAAIGPHGEVYVTWQLGPALGFGEVDEDAPLDISGSSAPVPTAAAIAVATSLDGGVTFSKPVVVANINSMRQDAPVGFNRARQNDHPRIAVATTGSHPGRLYDVFYSAVSPVKAAPVIPCPAGVVATACVGQNLVSTQIFLSFSDDKGATWTTSTAVAPPVPATGVKRFWPVVSINDGGNVNVVYLESQETPIASNPLCNISVGGGVRRVGMANSLVNTFIVGSTDGGATFGAPVEVSSATSNWCTAVSNIRPNFGDYIGSASLANKTFPLWGDGRNVKPDAFYATVQQ